MATTNVKMWMRRGTTAQIDGATSTHDRMFYYDTTLGSFGATMDDDVPATTKRYALTLDSSFNVITNGSTGIGNIILKDSTYIGLGGSKGRLLFGDSTQDFVKLLNGSMAVGIDAAPDTGVLMHLRSGTAITAEALSSTLLALENSGSAYLSFLTANDQASGMLFGDPESNVIGSLLYDHATDAMIFTANAAERMRITSAGLVGIGIAPTVNLQIGASERTDQIKINGHASNALAHLGNHSDTLYLSSNWYYDTSSHSDYASVGSAVIGMDATSITFQFAPASATPTRATMMTLTSAGLATIAGKLIVEKDTGGTYDSTTVSAIFGDSDAADSVYMTGNTLNAAYGAASDSDALIINYRGYQGGVANFRDFIVADGKGTTLLTVDGSAGNVAISGSQTNSGTITATMEAGSGADINSAILTYDTGNILTGVLSLQTVMGADCYGVGLEILGGEDASTPTSTFTALKLGKVGFDCDSYNAIEADTVYTSASAPTGTTTKYLLISIAGVAYKIEIKSVA